MSDKVYELKRMKRLKIGKDGEKRKNKGGNKEGKRGAGKKRRKVPTQKLNQYASGSEANPHNYGIH